jgi:protein-S-isoprenylcysteine O-methyltransferase Ste14
VARFWAPARFSQSLALVRSWAEAYLHSSVVHDSELHTERLMADGPYRYVRNPLHLGLILLAAWMRTMASRVSCGAAPR